ncbi:MAG TPA: DUF72 domain-containing protein [Gemmatimonadaceae bacterium]
MPAPKTVLPAPDLDPAHDPGFAAAGERADRAIARIPPDALGAPLPVAGHELRVGTASWTDPTIVKGGVFYPRGTSSAEDRLRYYASQFPVVEVDSSYYSLPEKATATLWAERTPPGFVFHVKAHALLTGQPTEVARLPEDVTDVLPGELLEKSRIYAKDLPPQVMDAIWERFLDALEPLRKAKKLGGVLLQYPRWFLPTPENKDLIAESATRLAAVGATVEFRNHLWFNSEKASRWTLDMLRDLELTHVIVDGPQGLPSSVPAVVEVTTPRLALVRLHGRRAATWEAAKVPTVERYRYLYSPQELTPWVERIEKVAEEAERTVVLYNNCYGNYGTTNARETIARLTAG